MEKSFISALNFETVKVQIISVDFGSDINFGKEVEDILEENDVDPNNSNFMIDDEFPLDLSTSDLDIMDKTNTVVRDEAIKRIQQKFDEKPETKIEFATWGSSSINAPLEYDVDGGFKYDGVKCNLSDFCTDDLLYILGEL